MEITKTTNETFERDGFLIVKNICDPSGLICDVPTTIEDKVYYGTLDRVRIKEKSFDSQVPNSCERYAYPLYKQYHSELKYKLETILGVQLYRTYYYDRFYFVGSDLKRHTDRPACEISISVNISSNINDYWDFYIHGKQGNIVGAKLNPGDGLIYKGIERPHWRHPLKSRHKGLRKFYNGITNKNDDTYYHQIFFHYVMADGYYVEYANEFNIHK